MGLCVYPFLEDGGGRDVSLLSVGIKPTAMDYALFA